MNTLTWLMLSVLLFGIMLGCGIGYAVCLVVDTKRQLKIIDELDKKA